MKIGQKLEHNLNSPFPKNILKFIIYKITLLIIKIIVLCNVLIIQNSHIFYFNGNRIGFQYFVFIQL